jgi:hypothetical protein
VNLQVKQVDTGEKVSFMCVKVFLIYMVLKKGVEIRLESLDLLGGMNNGIPGVVTTISGESSSS